MPYTKLVFSDGKLLGLLPVYVAVNFFVIANNSVFPKRCYRSTWLGVLPRQPNGWLTTVTSEHYQFAVSYGYKIITPQTDDQSAALRRNHLNQRLDVEI